MHERERKKGRKKKPDDFMWKKLPRLSLWGLRKAWVVFMKHSMLPVTHQDAYR